MNAYGNMHPASWQEREPHIQQPKKEVQENEMTEAEKTGEEPRKAEKDMTAAENAGTEQKEDMTLEEAFRRLDEMAERLEDKNVPLEESFQIYRDGMELLKRCSEKIDTVEKKMLQVNEDGKLTEF